MEVLRVTSPIINSSGGNASLSLRSSRSTNLNKLESPSPKCNIFTSKNCSSGAANLGSADSTSSSVVSASSSTDKEKENMDVDWFAGVADEELLYYSGIGASNDLDSLWTVVSSFVPPPPRPPFLSEDDVMTDGLTTCDLCSWAMRNPKYPSSLPGTLEAPGDIGWVLTLVIVSLVSAGIGAVFMVTLLRCRRLKSNGGRFSCCGFMLGRSSQRSNSDRESGVMPTDRPGLELDKLPAYHEIRDERSPLAPRSSQSSSSSSPSSR